MVKVLNPDNTNVHKLITRRTTERCALGAISKNVENNFMCDSKNCTAFSLALDESTDIQDVPRLAVFVRFV